MFYAQFLDLSMFLQYLEQISGFFLTWTDKIQISRFSRFPGSAGNPNIKLPYQAIGQAPSFLTIWVVPPGQWPSVSSVKHNFHQILIFLYHYSYIASAILSTILLSWIIKPVFHSPKFTFFPHIIVVYIQFIILIEKYFLMDVIRAFVIKIESKLTMKYLLGDSSIFMIGRRTMEYMQGGSIFSQ